MSLLAFSAWVELAEAEEAATAPALAECASRRQVVLAAATGFDAALLDEVRKDLAAELTPRGFCVRAARPDSAEPAAEIELSQRDGARVAIRVDDHTTGKQVSREVSLSKIPTGGVALAIAIAIDELLRASWAELMLRAREAAPAPEAGQLVPEAEPSAEHPPAPPASYQRWGLSALVGYAHASGNWDAFGPELHLALRPLRALLLELGAGGVFALPVESALGTAEARGASGLLSVQACAEPYARFRVCGGARASVFWLRFQGAQPEAAVVARDARLIAATLASLLQLRVGLVPRLALLGEASLGGAVRGARATDGENTLLGLDGLVVGAGLGLEVAL